MPDNKEQQIKKALRTVLLNCRDTGSREVIITADNVQMKHPYYGTSVKTINQKDIVFSLKDLEAQFTGYYYQEDKSIVRDEYKVIDALGIGKFSWDISDDEMKFKIKKNPATCIDNVVPDIGENLTKLRSLYKTGGLNIFIACDNESISNSLMQALISERSSVNLPTEASYPPVKDRYNDSHVFVMPQNIIDIPDLDRDAVNWNIIKTSRNNATNIFGNDLSKNHKDSNVYVFSLNSTSINGFVSHMRNIEEAGNDAILFSVNTSEDTPIGKIAFTSGLLSKVSKEDTFGDQSAWKIYTDKRNKRLGNNPTQPKTWHSTTLGVAKAFIKREAPRGKVGSSRWKGPSLYFNGPIACSIGNWNPIAAFVETPSGEPVLLMGRDQSLGGTRAARVSSAIGDIYEAIRITGSKVKQFDLLTLNDIVKWNNANLENTINRANKNEHELPKNATIDWDNMSKWIEQKTADLVEELDDAKKTKFPTFKKSYVYKAIANHAELRNELSAMFEVDLPQVADVEEYRILAKQEYNAAQKKKMDTSMKKERDASFKM